MVRMTTEMSDDEKFDQWLQGAARDYNRPAGETPREAMWEVVNQRLSAEKVAPVTPNPRRRTAIWWQAAAAVVLVATGVGIGRFFPSQVAVEQQRVADHQDSATQSAGNPNAVRQAGGASARTPGSSELASESYDVAAMQHLSRAEALLTSFRSNARGETTGSLDNWARDLLADTRLMLDSPAGIDAQRRRLLEDLELVLAQIVQLPAESSADRKLVQRSIERGAVLSRLRSTIPAGFTSGT